MTTTPNDTIQLTNLPEICSTDPAEYAQLYAEAVAAATVPVQVGDHSEYMAAPPGWLWHEIDVRNHEDHPRERSGSFGFTTIGAIATYVDRYKTGGTIGYIADIATLSAASCLLNRFQAVRYVLDDFDTDPATPIGNRAHVAQLWLSPTPAARRWGSMFGKPLTQSALVELIDDGTSEIADPAAADLRDLISDLHAIRTSSAKSVIRTGGGLGVEVAENVSLHAGPGNVVTVPTEITLTFKPWTAINTAIALVVKIRPHVEAEKVMFTLVAPHLEEELARVLGDIQVGLYAATSIDPLPSILPTN